MNLPLPASSPLGPYAYRDAQVPPCVPVMISVPHAGRVYPPALLALARVSPGVLALLEDPLVDRLVARAIGVGAASIIALMPRAYIDLNRSLDDLDPAMISPALPGITSRRASAGLGLIPSRLAGHGAIWRRKLTLAEVEDRIAYAYRPYHDALATGLSALRDRFGIAVLLDCHSMPPRGNAAPAVVFGDRGGASCGEWLVRAAEAACARSGIGSMRNDPYAGGEIVTRHGSRDQGIHALQIEVDRSLYLASNMRDTGAGFDRVASLLATIAKAVGEAALGASLAQAAE